VIFLESDATGDVACIMVRNFLNWSGSFAFVYLNIQLLLILSVMYARLNGLQIT